MLGLTQQRVADLVGVTYQQAHKYETGVNRISAGRLFAVAGALGVEVAHFYESLGGGPPGQDPQNRKLLELARDFAAITGPRRREALCHLARVMAGAEPAGRGGRGSLGRTPAGAPGRDRRRLPLPGERVAEARADGAGRRDEPDTGPLERPRRRTAARQGRGWSAAASPRPPAEAAPDKIPRLWRK